MGGKNFPSKDNLYTLPDGPYGYMNWETFQKSDKGVAQGADVNQVVINDFDGDGDPDIVAAMEKVENYKPGVFDDKKHAWYTDVHNNGGAIYGDYWFQVLRNDGSRQFIDVTEQGRDLGYRYYIALLPVDIDLDGDMDLIGQFWSKASYRGGCAQRWGTTFLINEGGLVFRTVEATDVFPELSSQAMQHSQASHCSTLGLGVFFPTAINADGMKGLFVAPDEIYSRGDPKLRVLHIQTTGLFHIPD